MKVTFIHANRNSSSKGRFTEYMQRQTPVAVFCLCRTVAKAGDGIQNEVIP